MTELLDLLLHVDVYLLELVMNYGIWIYAILFLIVFAETGLVVTPFLPGDSLLFAAGALAASGALDVAEDVAEAETRRHPQESAGDVVEREGAIAHVAGASDKRYERAHDWHKARDDDRLAAVLLEERMRLVEVIAIEQFVEEALIVVR